MIKIKKYRTDVKNFYMFVSHKKDGSENVTYGLVKNNGLSMIEIIPKYGPITSLKSDTDIIDDYINGRCYRGNWTQSGFDGNNINELLCSGELGIIANILDKYF